MFSRSAPPRLQHLHAPEPALFGIVVERVGGSIMWKTFFPSRPMYINAYRLAELAISPSAKVTQAA